MSQRYINGQMVEIPDTNTQAVIRTISCAQCAPFDCDNPDVHLAHEVPAEYTPLRNRGCHCGADFHGGDCMCFED